MGTYKPTNTASDEPRRSPLAEVAIEPYNPPSSYKPTPPSYNTPQSYQSSTPASYNTPQSSYTKPTTTESSSYKKTTAGSYNPPTYNTPQSYQRSTPASYNTPQSSYTKPTYKSTTTERYRNKALEPEITLTMSARHTQDEGVLKRNAGRPPCKWLLDHLETMEKLVQELINVTTSQNQNQIE